MKELLYALPGGVPSRWAEFGLTPAHMCYRVAPGPKLMGTGLYRQARGGAMLLSCAADPCGDPAAVRAFCRQILGECHRRGFTRLVCDFEGPAEGSSGQLAAALGSVCTAAGLPLYLPEAFARFAPGCRVLISSRLLSGTLSRTLSRAAEAYGLERVVLAVDARAEDYLLPACDPGETLEPEALRQLMRLLEPSVCFDHGLCAHYFTYVPRGGPAHFVLFDSPRSVRAKLDAAQALSIPSALLAAPQTESWLPELFGNAPA